MERVPAVTLVLMLISTTSLLGQATPTFSAGAGVDVAFPVGDFADDDLKTGFGYTVGGRLHFTPMLAIYAEFAQVSFGIDADFAGFSGSMADNGFALGGEIWVPTASRFKPVLRVGGIYNRAKFSGREGSISFNVESNRSLGFEVGTGLTFEVGENLQVVPLVRYRAFSPKFNLLGETGGGDMTYATLGAFLTYRFGS